MANLTRKPRWVRFEPDLGNNLELPPEERFYLEIASSLTKEQLTEAFLTLKAEMESVAETAKAEGRAETAAELAGAITKGIGEYVRTGPLTVDGVKVDGLSGYLEHVVAGLADQGGYNIEEVTVQLRRVNSFTGSRALFYERLSGGATSTQPPSTGLGGSQTAAPRNGSNTSSSVTSG